VHPNGLVYVGNVAGLFEYDGETWKAIPGTRGTIVHNLGVDTAGRIWYSATDGFGVVESDALGTLTARPLHVQLPPGDREVGHVLRMLVHGDDAYFVTQGAKGFVAHANARGQVSEIVAPAGERAVSLFVRDDAVHVITTAGVYRIEGESLVPVAEAKMLARLEVRSIWSAAAQASRSSAAAGSRSYTSDPGAWVISAAGLRLWRGDEAPLVSSEVAALLGEDRVSCGCPLGDGTFALGTEQHGLLIVDGMSGRVLARYDENSGLGATSSAIVALTLDANGGLWLSHFAGVTRVQINTPAAKHDGPHGVLGRVQGFAFHRGRLHVATTHGVFVRDPETGRFSELPAATGDSWVLLSTEDGLIVGGPDLRLIHDDGRVEIIERERLLFRSALRLRRDPDRIVTCTGPGLVRVYRREQGHWRFEAGLPNVRASLYPIFEDNAGRLWATRNRMQIVRLDWRDGVRLDAKLETLGAEHGLPEHGRDPTRLHVFLIDGVPEVSGQSGLWRYDASSDRFVPETRIAGRDPARWSRAWPLSDGSLWLANNHEGDRSAIALRTGPGAWHLETLPYTGLEAIQPLEICDEPAARAVWIGHLGLASFDRDWRGARAEPPRPRFREISTTSGRLLWGGSGAPFATPLAPELNSLLFEFAAPPQQPNAFGQANVQYRAKLDGFEREWSSWGEGIRRRYSNLPPGTFSLRVQARDVAGREGAVANFRFTVLPPWWRTWWCMGLEVIAGIGAIAGVTRWLAQRALRRRVAMLEAQSAVERERLRLARDLHDAVGSGLGRVILLTSEARRNLDDPKQLAPDLERVQETAQELMQHAREIVWAVSPQHDTLASLIERISDYVVQTLDMAGIACRVDAPAPGDIPAAPVASEARHSLFLAVKEAVHNCVKYSGATSAELRIAVTVDEITIVLRDFGRGFEPGAKRRSGHGLLNITARAEALGGRATIASTVGEGTTVDLRVPFGRDGG
jgi:signal transduction histidine kinase